MKFFRALAAKLKNKRRGIRYYPFEMHTHTTHSDGDFSVSRLVEYAKSRKLTGIAKTDHNTADGNDEFSCLCKSAGIVGIEGLELTSMAEGDATVLGQNAANYAHQFIQSQGCNKSKDFPSSCFAPLAKSIVSGDYDSLFDNNVADSKSNNNSDSNSDSNNLNNKKSNNKNLHHNKNTFSGAGSIGYAHPYRFPPAKTLANFDEKSGQELVETTHIEVWNGPNIEMGADYKDAQKIYLKILQSRPIAALAGADFHRPTSLGVVYPLSYLGIKSTPDKDKALGAIKSRKTYVCYGWKINDKDAILPLIGSALKPIRLRQAFTLDRLCPPLTGNYFEEILPHSVQVIACGKDGCFTINTALFELSANKTRAKAQISARLKAGTRVVLRVIGFAGGKETPLLITSPIEVLIE